MRLKLTTVIAVILFGFSWLYAQPALDSPINGVTGVSIEPTLSWSGGSADYTLTISKAADFLSDIVYSENLGAANSITFDEDILTLTNNTLYYWKVDGNGTESAVSHFTTVPGVTVIKTAPGDGVTVFSTTVDLYWYTGQPTGTMKYKVQYVLDDDLDDPGTEPTAAEWLSESTSSTVTDLTESITVLAGKTYWWRVTVLNSSNEVISYSTVWSFTVVGGIAINITQSWPVGNPTVYTYTPTCYWYPDQYALGVEYTVWYNTAGDDFGGGDGHIAGDDTDAASVDAGSDIYVTLPALTPGATYYWSVEAEYNGESTFSGIESFTVYNANPLTVPIATYPIGGVLVYTTSPYIYYYLGTDASGLYFDVELSTTSGVYIGNASFSTATPGQLYIQTTGLPAGDIYYYKLRSKNVVGVPGVGESSAWSDEYSFEIVGGIEGGYPVATWPIGDPTVYTRQPTLYWYLEGSSLDLTGYVLKYTSDAGAAAWDTGDWDAFMPGGPDVTEGAYSINDISATSYDFTFDLIYGETYYWAIASTDGADESDYSAGSFTVYGPASAVAPTLTAPSDGTTVLSRTQTLYWFINGSTEGFVSYSLTYSYSDAWADGATTTIDGITDNFKEITDLVPGATYWWYVTAVYTQGSEDSEIWSFTVDPGSSSVMPLIGGPTNININTTAPTLSWVLPAVSTSQLTYDLEIADNSEFTNAMVYEGITTPSQSLSGLEPGKEYFWRVKSSTDGGDVSSYSNTGKFVVNANITGVEDSEIVPTEFSVMQNYPNPFNPTTIINYSLPEASFVTIKVYDMLGREVKTLVNDELTAGIHNVNWNGDDNFGHKVSSGTYIYRVVAGTNVVARKMVLLK